MIVRKSFIAIPLLSVFVCFAAADDWPQWRGVNRDNISKEKGLLQQWPKGGPKLLWTIKTVGLGFSGPAVVGDVIFTMGAREDQEFAIALSAIDGKELWATKVGPIFMDPIDQFGDGPRATPTVDGDHVYVLGGHGELVCLMRDKGNAIWRKNLVKDFGGKVMEYLPPRNWGYCESPIIDGNKLICCPGGDRGWMIALDKLTGAVIWRTTEQMDQATDSSVVIAEIQGVRQYINSSFKGGDAGGGVGGVDAKTGKLLWYVQIPKYNIYAVIPTPVVKDDLVYVTAGYGAGCDLIQVAKDAAGKFSAKNLFAKNNRVRLTMVNETGGVLLWDGHIFGYSDGPGWVCQELKTGKEAWSEKNELEGKGSLTAADGLLFLLSDRGEAVLLKPSTESWQEKGRFTLPALSETRQSRTSHSGIRVWTPPVVANGRLYLRDQELLYCYEVK